MIVNILFCFVDDEEDEEKKSSLHNQD